MPETDSAGRPKSDSSNLVKDGALVPSGHVADGASNPRAPSPYEMKPSNEGLLQPPRSEFPRPMSPGALSNVSAEDEHVSGETPSGPARGGWRSKMQASWLRNKGIFMMLLAQIFGTLMNVTTRLLEVEGNKGQGLHPFQILFARMGITLVLSSAYMWWTETPHFPLGLPEVRWLLVARGISGLFGVYGMYHSLLYLPLADATVITFLAPGLACWACAVLINQPFTRREQIAGLVSLVGVVLIARPTALLSVFNSASNGPPAASSDSDSAVPTNTTSAGSGDAANYDSVTPTQRLSAVGVAMLGVLGTAVAFTTIRWIGKRAHPLISVNYFAGWCFLVSIVMLVALPDIGFSLPADLKEWGYLLFLGICGFVMQFLLAAGLAYENSSRTTNMTYTQMLFALLFDKLVFKHTPGAMSIIGSSLILGSAITVALQQSTNSQTKTSVESSHSIGDEESQRSLLNNMEGSHENHQLPVQEVQLRTLR